MNGKTLIFDFDGVIVNSINECLLTSYNAFLQFENIKLTLASDISEIPVQYQNYFYTYRKFVRPAGEYYLIHMAYKNNMMEINEKRYNELKTLYKNKLPYYQEAFFKNRHSFRMDNNTKWLSLHNIYSQIADCWKKLESNHNIFIVSNKDRLSIILLMDFFNLPVNEDHIFGAESGNNKSTIIESIIDKKKLNPESIFFIDDNLENLEGTKNLKIKLFLATWGYGNLNNNNDPDIEEIYPEDILQKLI